MFEFCSSFLNDKLTIMGFRQDALDVAYQGLVKFGVFLVAFTHGLPSAAGAWAHASTALEPPADDLLIYVIVPWLAHFFHLDIAQATTLFYKTSLLLALVLAMVGICLYCKRLISKLIAAFFIVVCFMKTPLFGVPSMFSDVYLAPIIITFALLPLFLYFHQKAKVTFFYLLFLFFSGLVLGYGESWRSFSSVPLSLLMFGFLIVDPKLIFKKKLFLMLSLFLGILVATLQFHSLIHKRDAYLAAHLPNYNAAEVVNKHSLWHSVYIGLGYYPNPYGITYNDEVGLHKAISIKPNVVPNSFEYNQVLKQAVFDFVAQNPAFVFEITKKKTMESLKSVNWYSSIRNWSVWIGMLLFILLQKTIYERLILLAVIACSLLPGIIVVPMTPYITGFIALLYLYTALGYGKCYEFLCLRMKRRSYKTSSLPIMSK